MGKAYLFLACTVGLVTPLIAGLALSAPIDFKSREGDLLAHRRHFRTVEHPVLGAHPAETHAIRFSAMAPTLRTAAPRLGQHTEHVLRTLLRMDADEYGRLVDGGVLE